MKNHQNYLIAAVVATVSGCAVRADESRLPADDPVEVRIDKDAIHSLMAGVKQVSVVGISKVAVVPNIAEISMGVTVSKPTASEAVAANNAEMNRLIEALKGRGVEPRDIQTSNISISPQYSRPSEPGPGVPDEATVAKVVGYEVSDTLRVTARDRAKLGDLLAAATEAGSNQLYGMVFRIDDREAILTSLRDKAFDDAKKKAEMYARRSGMILGTVVQITESEGGMYAAPQAPMGFAGMGGMGMAPAPVASPMPVAPGEQDVSLSVSVSFELKTPR
jgi:uncharacterized protein YggE